ncbi:hypothetical protein [Micromonospora eburnea]|uniref:hypothetical protein n=1 Tax=Micromonospora eburnea TaxID=227316 RepID=UPI003670FA26
MHREAATQSVDSVSYRTQYLGQLIGAEPGEAAGRGEQIQPLVARVGLLPVESPLFRVVELFGLADFVGDRRVPRLVHLQRTSRWLSCTGGHAEPGL